MAADALGIRLLDRVSHQRTRSREPFDAIADLDVDGFGGGRDWGSGLDTRAQEDEWLVVRCQIGERPAFDELIQRWHDPLWTYIRRLTGDDDSAKDMTQDVWLRVLRGIGSLHDGAKLRAWLFGIARRALMDRFREQYTTPTVSDVDVAELAAEDAPGNLEEESAAMQRELTQLPVTEREVLTLFYLRELSLGEVAEVLNVPTGTVKSRLFRARRLLRRNLEAKGYAG